MLKNNYQLGHLFYGTIEILHIYKIQDFLEMIPSSQNPKTIEKGLKNLAEKTTTTPDSNEQEKIKEISELIHELFHKASLTPPQGIASMLQRKTFTLYFTYRDEKIKTAWESFIQSELLPIIYKKCKEYKVPFDVAFLCLHESHGNPNAISRDKALGYWQFTEQTAKEYGLIRDGKDYRKDKEKSTDAAMRLLKDNYNRTKKWDTEILQKFHKNITENDRWLYAMYMYNGGKDVKKIYIALQGKIDQYATYQTNSENKKFVDMIFARKAALQNIAKKDPSRIIFGEIISNKNLYPKPKDSNSASE